LEDKKAKKRVKKDKDRALKIAKVEIDKLLDEA
jgi:hypothetical protein